MAVSTPYPKPAGLHDDALIMKSAALVAASAASATIIDTGPGIGHRVGVVHVNITAIEIASNDEYYSIYVQGSSDSDFGTAGNIVDLACIEVGAKEIKRTDSDRDDAVGNRRVYFDNLDESGTPLRYLRVYTVVAGTIATGINYSARLTWVPQVA